MWPSVSKAPIHTSDPHKANSSWKPPLVLEVQRRNPILSELWQPDRARYLLQEDYWHVQCPPPFFYYTLSWSNCKPTRECLAIINSCSWKRTRSHNCTFYNVHPGHCSTSGAMCVLCSWRHHRPGSRLKSEWEGTRKGEKDPENNVLVIKLLRSLRPVHFSWLLSEYVTTLYISTKLNLNLQN